jgi:hypothetical protein
MMIFDLAATIGGFLSLFYEQWYWVRLVRFVQLRSVFNNISEAFKWILTKFGLNKANIERVRYIINLGISMICGIHILGCLWIYIGKITECSWYHQGESG